MLQQSTKDKLSRHPDSDQACLVGLFDEWIGDGYLMTGSIGSLDYYYQAREWYEQEEERVGFNSLPACWGWGAEPEFDLAHFEFLDFAEWQGDLIEAKLPPLTEFDSNFFDRLEYKIEFVAESLDS